MPCILFSFAHPDDESFAAAGTAMKYGVAGVRTVLVTATRGERGKAGNPPVCPIDELGAYRERELREATRIIGFDRLRILDYRDQDLGNAKADEIRQSLVSIIRGERPDIVGTFDPHGFNLHPDHIAISRFTMDAVGAAADPRWHPEAGEAHRTARVLWTPPVAAWDAGTTPNLVEHPGADFVLDVSTWRERKEAALRAHRSQHLSIDRLFFSQTNLDRVLGVEVWRQAWGPRLSQRPSTDLFDGLD